MLALQQNDKAYAETQLKHLLTLDLPDKNIAYYYLGQIAEDDQRNDEALQLLRTRQWWRAVSDGADAQRALLANQGKLAEARQLLTNTTTTADDQRVTLLIAEAGLLRNAGQFHAAFYFLEQAFRTRPDNPELLYETALLAERIDRLELLETRLRRLIEMQPEMPQAYNALGYSYADRGIQLPEARRLIERALELAPDDVFILDSMGWVLYRQGDLVGALTHLERAYSQRRRSGNRRTSRRSPVAARTARPKRGASCCDAQRKASGQRAAGRGRQQIRALTGMTSG